MPMTHLPQIGATNRYRFLTRLAYNFVPNISGISFQQRIRHTLIVPVYGTSFLSGAGLRRRFLVRVSWALRQAGNLSAKIVMVVKEVFTARQHTDARYWYSNSVRPSVCPPVSHVPVSDENGLTYCHIFSPYGSPIILVLPASNIFTKFRGGHPLRGR